LHGQSFPSNLAQAGICPPKRGNSRHEGCIERGHRWAVPGKVVVMIVVQGVAVNSRSAAGPIATKGDPFLPMAVNVSGKKDKPRWESLRVFAREEAQLRRLRELVAERKSVVVKTVAEVFASVYERNGEARAGVSFSA